MGALRRKLDGDDARVEYATSLHKKSAARSEDDGGVEGILNMALSAYGEKKHQRWAPSAVLFRLCVPCVMLCVV